MVGPETTHPGLPPVHQGHRHEALLQGLHLLAQHALLPLDPLRPLSQLLPKPRVLLLQLLEPGPDRSRGALVSLLHYPQRGGLLADRVHDLLDCVEAVHDCPVIDDEREKAGGF